jgi:hypothetical protein
MAEVVFTRFVISIVLYVHPVLDDHPVYINHHLDFCSCPFWENQSQSQGLKGHRFISADGTRWRDIHKLFNVDNFF